MNMTKDTIVITYINVFEIPRLDIWSFKNINNRRLSEQRKDYPSLDLKRRKVSDIIDNDRIEDVYLKTILIAMLNDDKKTLRKFNYIG
jgi:hypothetical protein